MVKLLTYYNKFADFLKVDSMPVQALAIQAPVKWCFEHIVYIYINIIHYAKINILIAD